MLKPGSPVAKETRQHQPSMEAGHRRHSSPAASSSYDLFVRMYPHLKEEITQFADDKRKETLPDSGKIVRIQSYNR